MDFSFFSKYSSLFIEGTSVTVIISLVALVFGCIMGMLICLMKLSTFKVLRAIATTYIEILRGTPLFVQIYIIYFGFPQIGIDFPSIFGISSEILRSGIQSVDNGQMEASRSLGLGYASTMRHVIIPQAIKNILPSLANEFITLVKESAIISVIGVREIMFTASIVKNKTFKPLEPLIVAAIIYFVLTFTLSKLVGKFEKKLAKANA